MGTPLPMLPLLASAILAAACHPLVVEDTAADAYVPLAGGELILHRDLTVPPGTAQVYFQRGEVVHGRNLYVPSCGLEVADVRETPQIVRADRFTITRAGIGRDEYLTAAPRHLAALGIGVRMGGLWVGRDDGAPMVMYVIAMALESERQPNVLNLTCRSALDDPAYVERLTIQDMQSALGAVATLRPAAP